MESTTNDTMKKSIRVAIQKIDLRLMPFIFLLHFIAYTNLVTICKNNREWSSRLLIDASIWTIISLCSQSWFERRLTFDSNWRQTRCLSPLRRLCKCSTLPHSWNGSEWLFSFSWSSLFRPTWSYFEWIRLSISPSCWLAGVCWVLVVPLLPTELNSSSFNFYW